MSLRRVGSNQRGTLPRAFPLPTQAEAGQSALRTSRQVLRLLGQSLARPHARLPTRGITPFQKLLRTFGSLTLPTMTKFPTRIFRTSFLYGSSEDSLETTCSGIHSTPGIP